MLFLCNYFFISAAFFMVQMTSTSNKVSVNVSLRVVICPECTPPLAQSQLGQAPAHCDSDEEKLLQKMVGWMFLSV